MELLTILMDLAPMPPEPGLLGKIAAAISAFVGGIAWSSYQLIKKTIKKKGDKK